MDRITFERQARSLGIPRSQIEVLVQKELYMTIPANFALKRMHFEQLFAGLTSTNPAPPTQNKVPHLTPQRIYAQDIPQAILEVLPVSANQKKKEGNFTGFFYTLSTIVVIAIAFFFLMKPQNGKPTVSLVGLGASEFACEKEVETSTLLVFENVKRQGKSLLLPKNTPLLQEKRSCIYFSKTDMIFSLGQEVNLKNVGGNEEKYTGRQIMAIEIVRGTAKEHGKDSEWVEDLYSQVFAALDETKIETVGEYGYLVLPGIDEVGGDVPLATKTAFVPETTSGDPEVILESAPLESPTPLPTDTPLPTNIPQPTLERFVTEVNKNLATAMDKWDVTPLPTEDFSPSAQVVSLEYFVSNILRGGGACSPDFRDYSERWTMDNVVTLILGPECTYGDGHVTYVQLPEDIATRHFKSPSYPQIFLSTHPYARNGPVLDLGNGYFLQPFE